jgi:hypothetical protein
LVKVSLMLLLKIFGFIRVVVYGQILVILLFRVSRVHKVSRV